MAVKIKICGLSRPEDIAYVNEYKPDYVGFVFFEKSTRFVSLTEAVKLRQGLATGITPVGVFLDNPLEEILAVVESGAVDIVQLHGATAPALVKRLKEENEFPVWEAITIRTSEDIIAANESPADLVLLDHGAGGTGQSFDWSLLHGLERDFILAGGLNASNIKEALKLRPYGVDTSSGVETEKKKDKAKIEKFIAIIRQEEI